MTTNTTREALTPTRSEAWSHLLKTDPEVFQAVYDGRKTFEIRHDDRGYKVGDTLDLHETLHTGRDMAMGSPLVYTGRSVKRTVSHVLSGYGLAPGWVCLSLVQPELVGLRAERDRLLRARVVHGDIFANHSIAMQAAVIEARVGKGPEAGIQWIVNTLVGPGLYPDMIAAEQAGGADPAQAWFDAKMAEHDAFRAANPGPAPAAPALRVGPPPGYRLLPEEPTPEMMDAGEAAVFTGSPAANWAAHTGHIYRSMIAAIAEGGGQ